MGHYIFVQGANGVIARYSAAAAPPEGAVILSEEEARRKQYEIEAAHHLAMAKHYEEVGFLRIDTLGSLFSCRQMSGAEAAALGGRSTLFRN